MFGGAIISEFPSGRTENNFQTTSQILLYVFTKESIQVTRICNKSTKILIKSMTEIWYNKNVKNINMHVTELFDRILCTTKHVKRQIQIYKDEERFTTTFSLLGGNNVLRY